MFDDLKGKVVVVTGGVTGIGGAVSGAFAEAGAKVVAQYHNGGPELAAVEKATGPEIVFGGHVMLGPAPVIRSGPE